MNVNTATAPDLSATKRSWLTLKRHRPSPWKTWLGSVVFAMFVLQFVISVAFNPRLRWGVFQEYLFADIILRGILLTLQLTFVCMCFAIFLAVIVAAMATSKNAILVWTARVYTWVLRSVPPLVQILIWFNIAAVFPVIGLGIPLFGPTFLEFNTNSFITAFVAAVLALGFTEGAYMSEIVRAGLISVGTGQREASMALGMTSSQTMRKVVFPQAIRVIIPPTVNQIIHMMKMTSLVAYIGLTELMFASQIIYNTIFEPIPLLLVASAWYLVMTSVLTMAQIFLERRLTR